MNDLARGRSTSLLPAVSLYTPTASCEDFFCMHACIQAYMLYTYVYMCPCVWAHVCACAHVYVWVWKPKVIIGRLQSPSLFYLLRQHLLPGVSIPASKLASGEPHLCLRLSDFMWVLGIRIPVLILPASFCFSVSPRCPCLTFWAEQPWASVLFLVRGGKQAKESCSQMCGTRSLSKQDIVFYLACLRRLYPLSLKLPKV